ncbi:ATP-binding cassette domain-containing protein [bacterium]|nr:ATP-binding cassette domain-containing protein [bacterium]
MDGNDYRDVSKESLRDQIALVRGLEVLSDTILDNIRMGRPEVTLESARAALAQLGLLDEITQLPRGIHTQLSGEGRPLSVGQVHRIVLARAIVTKPRLVLVDETLDDLDEKSREIALKLLLDPKAPWTLVLATHDMNLAKRCEVIISLDSLTQRRSA